MRHAQNDETGTVRRSHVQSVPGPRSRRCRIAGQVAAILTLIVAASVVAGPAGAATGRRPADTTTVTWRSPELPGFYSIYLPRLQCPGQFPYMLDQQFNLGSGFRIRPGLQFTDYRQGFDVVALSTIRIPFRRDGVFGHMNVGITGDRDIFLNSATNWALTPTRFTLIMHCTSDASRGLFDRQKDS